MTTFDLMMQPTRTMTIIMKEPHAPNELINHIIHSGLRDIKFEIDVVGSIDGHRVNRFHNPRGEEHCEGADSPGVVQLMEGSPRNARDVRERTTC